ncbi:DNA repair protein RecO [Parasphingopyxis lamellibrachiae]|uniref:DNA repair protein RecO n=1 Tax=Parasphingopyxis lamellibrachiae TaxID=680125 RepID=A0A3D9FDU0_9SPHN|nr:DNA repair protein RecO [Parasphingopyxis lamellibrachiae]RED15216.1 DNA replication and repair protein RecO [Parasphingopyxis lamellibrachiae]
MQLRTRALVCAIRPHGEHGAIARLMTPENGLVAGYVLGGRSRRIRPVLLAGNIVEAEFRARTEEQLAGLTVELVTSRSGLYAEPLAASAIEWSCALTAAVLPESHSYPQLYAALDGVLAAIEAAPSARRWASALVRYELLLLTELGFGLDLTQCAVTGSEADLQWVSPKSGAAVSASAGEEYRDRLLALPAFLVGGGEAEDWDDIFDGFRLTGHFLARNLLDERRNDVMAARERLVERLGRAA